MLTNIRWRTVLCAMAASTMSTLAFAEDPVQSERSALSRTIKAGDTVSVTRWSGGTLKGQVTAATDCALRVRSPTGIHEVSVSDIKTVRRHKTRKINGAATVMLQIANQCDEIGCAPAALASAGIGALVQGVDKLAHPPKVIYRSKAPSATSLAIEMRSICTGEKQP
jgi:hypothetical protein